MAWQHVSPEVTVKGFKKCCICFATDGTADDIKRVGMLGVSVRKMKALTVKMETVTLIGKGGLKHTFLFLGVVLDSYKYILLW